MAIQEFENSDLSKKVDAISERIDKLQKTDVNSSVKRNLKFAYSPKVVDVEVGTGKNVNCIIDKHKVAMVYAGLRL